MNYIEGFCNYFKQCIHWFDLLIIVFGICSIVVFATIENVNTKIEGSTFIAILIIRNVFYVIRIAVLIKSEQLIRVSIINIMYNRKILKR